jgi:hypothetical protein
MLSISLSALENINASNNISKFNIMDKECSDVHGLHIKGDKRRTDHCQTLFSPLIGPSGYVRWPLAAGRT